MRLILLACLLFSKNIYAYTYAKDELYINVFVSLNKKIVNENCKNGISEVIEYDIIKEKSGKPLNHHWIEEWTIKSCQKIKKIQIEFKQENRIFPNVFIK